MAKNATKLPKRRKKWPNVNKKWPNLRTIFEQTNIFKQYIFWGD